MRPSWRIGTLYCLGAAQYSFARTVVRTRGSTVSSESSTYVDMDNSEDPTTCFDSRGKCRGRERSMLRVERCAAATLAAVAGIFLLPLYLFSDVCWAEAAVRRRELGLPSLTRKKAYSSFVAAVCDFSYP